MATASPTISSPTLVWVDRGRFVLATALVWAGLHFLAGFFLQGGLDRPLVLAPAPLAGVLVAVVLAAGGVVARALGAARNLRRLLALLGIALLLWAAEGGRAGGTMDSWLLLRNPIPQRPAGGPYWLLLVDYIYLVLGIGGAWALAGRGESSRPSPELPRRNPGSRSGDAVALLVSLVVAGIAIFVLTGRPLGHTLRGQVYFAVGVGLLFGVWTAGHITHVRRPSCYAPAPFLLGIVGLLVAGIRPGLMLPAEYQHLDILPAWGLARALPIEMVGAGLVGALWLLPKENDAPADEP